MATNRVFTIRTAGAAALLACLMSVARAAAAADSPAYEQKSTAAAPYAPVRVLDTDRMPIQGAGGDTGWGSKELLKAPNRGALRILYTPPGGPGAYIHYHTFHEWAYNIAGDFSNNEATMPDAVMGPMQRFVEGNFLSRPPYSLHGGERGRMPWMSSQVGSVILIFEEGGVNAGSYTVDPAVRNQPPGTTTQGMKYNPDYKKIMNWSTPRILDTINKMVWQPVEGVPGLNVKHLIDDPSHGFRANLWFLEPGAATPKQFQSYYYKQAYELYFVINGDLTIQSYSAPNTRAQAIKLGKNFFVDRPPMGIFGLAESGATKGGAIWLQVTYAKGLSWTDTPTPIEEPTRL